MKTLSKQWAADYQQLGVKAEGQFSITCINFTIQLQEEWIKTEKELLEVEIAFQKLPKVRRKMAKIRKKS